MVAGKTRANQNASEDNLKVRQINEIISKAESPIDAMLKMHEVLISSMTDAPWETPKKWRAWNRSKGWTEYWATQAFRQWVAGRLKPYLERLDKDMRVNGFDPEKKDHFAVINTMLALIPSRTNDIAKLFKMSAEYFGHFSDNSSGTKIILADDIQEAVIALKKKAYAPSARLEAYRTIPPEDDG